ncbi:transposable element Tcb1 transposase [Trichonephila clavipes]|nr:transposable element Tcb1 transposase [Trichonephila clavipes]
MSRRKKRSAFDQVSEFDRGRIIANRDWGLSFREIGSRVGRNQTTVMQICDRCIQEGTTDRRGQSPPPQCITSREDRTTDVSAANDAMKEGCGWQNGIKLFLLTNHASVCNTTMFGFESGDTVERGCWTAALCTATLILHRARSPDLSPIESMWSMVAQRLTQITPPAATPDQFWKRVEAAWCCI